MSCKYYKGAKTLKWINNKNSGPIRKDFDVTKSFESFCTDESMKSWDSSKAALPAKSREKKIEVVEKTSQKSLTAFMSNSLVMSVIAGRMKKESSKVVRRESCPDLH